ncbi:MAG: gliding motility-associated ABC transporter permease subunit GldF [Bacteroidota bacterium]
MIIIFKKEINDFLNSFIAYIVMAVFLVGTGLVMWVFPDSSVLDYGYASMESLFTLGPYLFLFLIPAITMKSFAEEKRTGTLELLYSLPFRDWEIILGKYFSSFALVAFALLPTIVYYYSIHSLGSPTGNLDTPGIIGSYVGLLLLGGLFTAIGMLASALTENQIISFVLAAFLCFFLYEGIETIAGIDAWGSWSYQLEQWGMLYHYNALSRGLLDLRDVVYFLGMITFMLLMVRFTLSTKKA